MIDQIKDRVINNGRSTALGFVGGALSSAGMVAGFGVTDWRVLAGVAAAGALAGAVSKDPAWLKKKAAIV